MTFFLIVGKYGSTFNVFLHTLLITYLKMFISKTVFVDKPNSDLDYTLLSMERKLRVTPLLTQMPLGK